MKLHYQARIDKAVRQVFRDEWRGKLSDVSVQHDGWCAIYSGDGCNCDPNITMTIFRPTIQLTDGGPSVTPELPSCVAGPPFGAAHGSAFCSEP
jgi:hypothetical protein